jgi:FkbM family methyltransferase
MIKAFIKENISIYKKYKNRNVKNIKTAISLKDEKKLLKMPRFTEGSIKLKNLYFIFSDSIGFLHSLEEIFNEEVYKFKTDKKAPLIIDCGSNIGLSIYYFREKYPEARIIGFEADSDIFKLLEKNTNQFLNHDKIQIKKEAVWVEDTVLPFFSEGSLAGSLNVDFSGKKQTKQIQAIDFRKYLNEEIDFLKIDIEGAENKLIFHIKDDLKNVKNLFLEYHGLIGEQQNLGDILNLLTEVGFEYYIRLAGETLKNPFCKEKPGKFNQQLNIFCYRK